MLEAFVDLFFPRRSIGGAEGAWVTMKEQSAFRRIKDVDDTAALRSAGLEHIDRIIAATRYHEDPLVRKALHQLKYRRHPALAEVLGSMIAYVSPPGDWGAVIVPVPLHWSRKFARGCNQSELLARIVARHRGLPVRCLLERARPTGFQAHRNRDERLTAMRGAFRVTAPPPVHVILIDDVATTGATLDACAAALKRAGACSVEGWVVARG